MKLSHFLATILSIPVAKADLSRALHDNATDLSNGAELGVDIVSPALDFSGLTLDHKDGNATLVVKGEAHVGMGAPDVAYIYIIDSSGSTDDWDGDCGTTLQCVQAFFEELNNEAIVNGSAKAAGVIDFDDHAWVTSDFEHPTSPKIREAIYLSSPDGGTNCKSALEFATIMAHEQMLLNSTVVVVFAGDGMCNGGDETSIVSDNVTEAADILGDTGAIVHTIAVGTSVDCTPDNNLVDIPRNGGVCFSIPDPKSLPTIIDDIIGIQLTSLEVKVDDDPYRALGSNETGGIQLPRSGAFAVAFEVVVDGLAAGNHKICVRATGNDTISGEARIEDCHMVLVGTAAPTSTPSSTPSLTPTAAPSSTPSASPTEMPSLQPSSAPTTPKVEILTLGWKITLGVTAGLAAIGLSWYQYNRWTSRATSVQTGKQLYQSEEFSEEVEFEDEPVNDPDAGYPKVL